jgi:AcrR family transcriptional regulator
MSDLERVSITDERWQNLVFGPLPNGANQNARGGRTRKEATWISLENAARSALQQTPYDQLTVAGITRVSKTSVPSFYAVAGSKDRVVGSLFLRDNLDEVVTLGDLVLRPDIDAVRKGFLDYLVGLYCYGAQQGGIALGVCASYAQAVMITEHHPLVHTLRPVVRSLELIKSSAGLYEETSVDEASFVVTECIRSGVSGKDSTLERTLGLISRMAGY